MTVTVSDVADFLTSRGVSVSLGTGPHAHKLVVRSPRYPRRNKPQHISDRALWAVVCAAFPRLTFVLRPLRPYRVLECYADAQYEMPLR